MPWGSRSSWSKPSPRRDWGGRSWIAFAAPPLDAGAGIVVYTMGVAGRGVPLPGPKEDNSMKRFVAAMCLAIIALAPLLLVTDAWARAGGGSSGGSRGSRSYSSPARPSPSPAVPSQPSSPPSSYQQPQPQRSGGWGAGIMGGLAGLALGGLLGSMLFGHGGGIGLLEILLIAGGAYLIFRMMRSRQATPE